MDDAQNYARLAAHLNSKKAGPLVCPICGATESFEAKGASAGGPRETPPPADLVAPAEPLASIEPQFAHATCTNCGYSIFFDTEALPPPTQSVSPGLGDMIWIPEDQQHIGPGAGNLGDLVARSISRWPLRLLARARRLGARYRYYDYDLLDWLMAGRQDG